MHESEKKCIGIDVGGTSVKIGLFETDGTLLFKWEVPTRKEEGGRYILEDVAASIREVLMEKEIHLSDILGAGLGIPGPVMPDGYVEVCVNLGWRNVNPQKELSAMLDGIPVRSGNDANVAALGEMWRGGGMGFTDIVMVTLGTGVSCTDACSILVVITCLPALRFAIAVPMNAILFDSVPPDVKIISFGLHFN